MSRKKIKKASKTVMSSVRNADDIRSEELAPCPGRRRTFLLVTTSIPLLFFLALEGGLRLFGYGDSYPLFVPLESFPEWLNVNDEVAQRYFSSGATLPTANVEIFPAAKPTGSIRLVVQGGSTAAGFPYYRGGSFSRMLEHRLRATYPESNVDVINTAMAAVNTYTVLDQVDEIIDIKPDAVLVYAGHNEYYGALGVGSSQSMGTSPALIRLYLSLRRVRIVQLLKDTISAVAGWFSSANSEGTLMQRMVREQSIPLSSASFRAGLEQYESNLERILERYKRAGIPVYLGTLASNERDQVPFDGRNRSQSNQQTFVANLSRVSEVLEDGQYDEALVLARSLVETDSAAADAWYALGRALEGIASRDSSESSTALSAFQRARDLDALRFRAPTAFNGIVRRLAEKHGAILVDVEERFRRESRGRIIGSETILEHLHPNMEGYLLMADAYYSELVNSFPFAEEGQVIDLRAARRMVVFSPADSLTAVYRLENLTGNWPFIPAGAAPRRVGPGESPTVIESLAFKLFRNETSWYDATNELVGYFEERGEFQRALDAANAVVDEYPIAPKGYLNICQILLKTGDYKRAEAVLEQAASRTSVEEGARFFLNAGVGLVALEQPAAAMPFIERSHERLPTPESFKMMGTLQLNRFQEDGNPALLSEALANLESSFALNPVDKQLLYNLAGGYLLADNGAKAQEMAQTMRRLFSGDPEAEQLLASLGF